jgi:pyrimidine operon attenuation protein/uracil phosphoribosyltransferase
MSPLAKYSKYREKAVLLKEVEIAEIIRKVAQKIIKLERGVEDLSIIGIQTGGVQIARRIKNVMELSTKRTIPLGIMDITLYRDDIFLGLPQPLVKHTEIPFEVTNKKIILVDDVLYTGRTIRAALDAIIDFGRPGHIRLAVLVDRGLREYPIQADVAGYNLKTTHDETVRVQLREMGFNEDRVVLYEK